MLFVLGLTISIILIVLSVLHFHWAFGGLWGFDKALPTNEKGVRVLNPKKLDSAIVGLGLLIFSIFYLIGTGVIFISLPAWVYSYIGWIIPAIFTLRALGDFRYVGFFKKVK